MARDIYQGSTATIKMKPLGGIDVDDASLGDPTITLVQDDIVYVFEGQRLTINSSANTVSVTLTEAETIELVEDVPAEVELVFSNDQTESVIRFGPIELNVLESIMGAIYEHMEPDDPNDTDFDPDDLYEDVVEDGEVEENDEVEVYDIEDYEEYYDDTLEEDPEELYPIEEVEPADENPNAEPDEDEGAGS